MDDFLLGTIASIFASLIFSFLSSKGSKKALESLKKKITLKGEEVELDASDISASLAAIEDKIFDIKYNPKVFISHSHKNIEIADKLVEELSRHNIDAFLDSSAINLGNDIKKRIEDNLAETNWLIPIITNDYNKSKRVDIELQKAVLIENKRQAKMILPVVFGDVEVPGILANREYVDLKNDYKNAIKTIVSTINKTCSFGGKESNELGSIKFCKSLLLQMAEQNKEYADKGIIV